MDSLIQSLVIGFVGFANSALMTIMVLGFISAVALRSIIYYTVLRELWFVREFEKRLYAKLDAEREPQSTPFSVYLRKLLEKTYYEVFELRSRYRRRNPDFIMSLSDRVFLIQDGAARLIRDTLKYLRYHDRKDHTPHMFDISKNVFNSNPAFSRIFGILPASTCNSLLEMLPGLFIIGGILGTFIGMMTALPQLSGMDLSNAEQTKTIMDGFLAQMSHALVTSILGIVLSISMSLFNSVCDPEGLFVTIVDRYSSALNVVWTRCNASEETLDPRNSEEYYETNDELAAHESVERQLARHSSMSTRDGTRIVPQAFQPLMRKNHEFPAPLEEALADLNHDEDDKKKAA